MTSAHLTFDKTDDKHAHRIEKMRSSPVRDLFSAAVRPDIISLSGGIDIMVTALEAIMGPRTAATIMSVTAGIMSFFSSGLGVVFPTLIPTASGLAASLGVDAIELVAVIVIGGTVAGFTPISTTGALIMAGVAQQENAEEKFPQNRLFVELFAVSFLALAVLALFAFIGVYRLFL